MATVRPFKGLRPLPQYAAQVAAKPYDVLTSEEARAEAAGNPLTFLHVGKPEIDLSPTIDVHDELVYRQAKENFSRLITDGVLIQEQKPALYLYALSMEHHRQFGIAGCVSVQEYLSGTIKKHELTRPDKEEDRTRHIAATNAHAGPILLTYHAEPAIDDIVDELIVEEPEYDFQASDGIRHQLWVIRDAAQIHGLVHHFLDVSTLYVADGHHRTAAAANVGMEMTRSNPRHTGKEEYNYFLAVLFPHNQLQILEYNRLVKDLHGLSRTELVENLEERFHVHKVGERVRPDQKGEFGMFIEGRWYRLQLRPDIPIGNDPVERLDVTLLQSHILGPLFDIQDQRTDTRIDFVGGIRGLEELERRVNSGEMAAAFSLYPTSIEELLSVADAGRIMPPKSTWFEPKLRDGLVVHMLG